MRGLSQKQFGRLLGELVHREAPAGAVPLGRPVDRTQHEQARHLRITRDKFCSFFSLLLAAADLPAPRFPFAAAARRRSCRGCRCAGCAPRRPAARAFRTILSARMLSSGQSSTGPVQMPREMRRQPLLRHLALEHRVGRRVEGEQPDVGAVGLVAASARARSSRARLSSDVLHCLSATFDSTSSRVTSVGQIPSSSLARLDAVHAADVRRARTARARGTGGRTRRRRACPWCGWSCAGSIRSAGRGRSGSAFAPSSEL